MDCHIPMQTIGPLHLRGPQLEETQVMVPLATFESPLWPSVNRGAKVSRAIGGLSVAVLQEGMTRSVVLECPRAVDAWAWAEAMRQQMDRWAEVVAQTSRFARLQDIQIQLVGRQVYARVVITTGDASGHNMVTAAADALLRAWEVDYPGQFRYVSVSGNCCVDKKVSAINGILGRGKSVVAEGVIPADVCQSVLKTTPARIADLNIKKNWMGGVLAGSIRTANAHFANMLLAVYLATGQDAANIVEGSQGTVVAEVEPQGHLYFAINIPNVVVGTVGNGKHLPFVQAHLAALGCLAERPPGDNARRLAQIIAGVVWCGELSLLAAQTNPGELMRAHVHFERERVAAAGGPEPDSPLET